MITISRRYTFEAAHHLPHVPEGHKCGRVHGHSYTVEVALTGVVGADGWVMDFADVDSVVSPLVALLDHRSLNDFIENPTSENLTLWFAAALGALPLAYIEVSETAKSKARWSP